MVNNLSKLLLPLFEIVNRFVFSRFIALLYMCLQIMYIFRFIAKTINLKEPKRLIIRNGEYIISSNGH